MAASVKTTAENKMSVLHRRSALAFCLRFFFFSESNKFSTVLTPRDLAASNKHSARSSLDAKTQNLILL